jgi:ketosteroid isomerase-like protein
MEPRTPENWWPLFQAAMAAGDVEAVLRLYEPGAVFAGADRHLLTGHAELRHVMEPLANARADFQYTVVKIIQTGDLALVHSETRLTRPRPSVGYALEVLRRQPDGRWLLAIGDPFTIGELLATRTGKDASSS